MLGLNNYLPSYLSIMNWEAPEKTNLKRLKCIKDELEEFINMLEQQYENNTLANTSFVNNELYSNVNNKHKTRTAKQINVDMNNLEHEANNK